MRHCPRCEFEYRSPLSTCSNCGGPLLEGTLPESASVPRARPVQLTRVTDPSMADVIRAVLASAGIPAFVRRHGPITGELGRVTDGLTEDYAVIVVPESRLSEAQQLLADLEAGAFEWPEGLEPDE